MTTPVEKRAAPTWDVRHYLPGGLENGGGIGRLVGYIVDAAAPEGSVHLVSDTRGPGWSSLRSPVWLASAIGAMFVDRIRAPRRIHHVHVAGRGSTARKILLCAAARAFGCAYILHLHDYDYAADYARRPAWQRMLARRMFQGADRVIVLGQRDRAIVLDLLGVKPDRVVVLGNCVPDPGPNDRPARSETRIVFLGQLSERKGVPELLAALADPAMASLPWHATLAGDGPVARFRALADDLGLGSKVSMPGWVDRPTASRLCAEADILVLPSHNEGMAMAVIEGLAHGLAVVTTRVGAHEEAITDGVTGLFVPVGEPGPLAAALAGLIVDPVARDRLSQAARTHFLARYSMRSYMPALSRVYAGIRSGKQTDVLIAGERRT